MTSSPVVGGLQLSGAPAIVLALLICLACGVAVYAATLLYRDRNL